MKHIMLIIAIIIIIIVDVIITNVISHIKIIVVVVWVNWGRVWGLVEIKNKKMFFLVYGWVGKRYGVSNALILGVEFVTCVVYLKGCYYCYYYYYCCWGGRDLQNNAKCIFKSR